MQITNNGENHTELAVLQGAEIMAVADALEAGGWAEDANKLVEAMALPASGSEYTSKEDYQSGISVDGLNRVLQVAKRQRTDPQPIPFSHPDTTPDLLQNILEQFEQYEAAQRQPPTPAER